MLLTNYSIRRCILQYRRVTRQCVHTACVHTSEYRLHNPSLPRRRILCTAARTNRGIANLTFAPPAHTRSFARRCLK